MPFLLVDTDGFQVARDAERIVVREGSVTVAEYLPREIDCVIESGRVEMTRAAMDMLASRGVAVHLVGHNGRYQGCIMPAHARSARRCRAQYQLESDPGRRLALATVATEAELQNLRVVIRRWGAHRRSEALEASRQRVGELARMLADVTTSEEMRGIEGNAWRACFAVVADILPASLGFSARRRRPAPDPLNAVLGLFGTITVNTAATALRCAGLDPGVGYLHGSARGGPALAADICDIYRPSLCLAPAVTLFSKRILTPSDFIGLGYSATLTRDGMRKALGVYARTCRREVTRSGQRQPHDYLWHLYHDAETLARALTNPNHDWRPLRVR